MKKFLFFSIMAIYAFLSCTEDTDVIVDERTENYRLYDYYVDSNGNEGIVCYADTSNSSNKTIIVISADEAYLSWGPLNDAVFREDSVTEDMQDNPSFGLSMLQIMTLKGINHYPAMNWCAEKNPQDVAPNSSCWRLPTRSELAAIFGYEKYAVLKKHSNLSKLNEALKDIGATLMQENNYYWTCNENFDTCMSSNGKDNRKDLAVPMTINNVSMMDKELCLKKNKYYVRAIKYIYYKKSIG